MEQSARVLETNDSMTPTVANDLECSTTSKLGPRQSPGRHSGDRDNMCVSALSHPDDMTLISPVSGTAVFEGSVSPVLLQEQSTLTPRGKKTSGYETEGEGPKNETKAEQPYIRARVVGLSSEREACRIRWID